MSDSPAPQENEPVQSQEETLLIAQTSEELVVSESDLSALPEGELPRDAAYWARSISTLKLSRVPTGALNLNVEGRHVIGPLQGFGQLWQKTFRVRLPGIEATPAEVMQTWKEHFPEFQPPVNRFFPVLGVEPGQIILINASATGMPVSTGVVVLYADDESFTLTTAEGHPESGWVTFSVAEEDGCIVCQVQTMARANDPLYELAFRLGAGSAQDRIWTHVLEALATHFGVNGQVQSFKTCIDSRLQWSEAKNVWHNAALRTLLYTLGAPLRWPRRVFRGRKK